MGGRLSYDHLMDRHQLHSCFTRMVEVSIRGSSRSATRAKREKSKGKSGATIEGLRRELNTCSSYDT